MSLREQELYEDIVYDICANETPKYDNLVVFVHNLLNARVKHWCYNDYVLYGGMHHEDVMQEIQIKIIKSCETYFFKPINGKTDKTCDEFKAWCYRVAKNYFITYCAKQNNNTETEFNPFLQTDDPQAKKLDTDSYFEQNDAIETDRDVLNRCFEIVFDLKSSPHIVMTWLLLSLVMLDKDAVKIKSTHLIAQKFSSITLFEMYDMIIYLIDQSDWICCPPELINKQKHKLEIIDDDTGKMIGDMKYEDFYMNKGPEMSISDWVNRINTQIKKRIEQRAD